MFKNKLFIIGFVAGAVVSLVLTFIFVFQYPLLLTDNAKLSYIIGQQMGRSSRVQSFDISTPAFLGAVRDAKNDSNRLTPEDQEKARALMMSIRDRDRQARRGGRPEFDDKMDAEGFFTTPRGVKFKMLSDSKKEIQSLREIMGSAQRAQQFEFALSIKDSSNQEIHQATKKMKLERQELPRELFEVLSYLDKNEKLQVKFSESGLAETAKLVSLNLTPGHTIVVQRLSVESSQERRRPRR